MAQRVLRQRAQTLGEQDGGLVRATGEHRVFERVELIFQRCIDTRIRVAEQVDPPRADGIEIAMAVVVVEPRALAASDGHERRALVMLHLRTRVPYGA